jgi:hypothetical protein
MALMAAFFKPISYEEFPVYFKAHYTKPRYDSSCELKLPHAWWDFPKEKIDHIL